MTNFPTTIYSPRTKENRPGIIYNEANKTIGYAEDVVKLDDEVVALQTKVGVDGSAIVTTLDYLLKNINSINPGHKHNALSALDDSPAQALYIDNDGNVGIGTITPTAKLDLVDGDLKTTGDIYVNDLIATGDGNFYELIITKPLHNWLFTSTLVPGALGLVPLSAAYQARLQIFDFAGDGNNNVIIDMYGAGKPTNFTGGHRLTLGWAQSLSQYLLWTETYPLYLRANGQANQLILDTNGKVGIGLSNPHSKFEVAGAISSAFLNLTAEGPTDDLNVAGVNTVFVDTNYNNVTLGGLVGGVEGQYLNIVLIDWSNDFTVENEEGSNQNIYLHAGADVTIPAGNRAGFLLVCDGSDWYDVSHSRHI